MRSDPPGHLGDRYEHRPVPHPDPPGQRPGGFRCARCLAQLKAHAEGVWLIWTDAAGRRACLETRVTVTRPVAAGEAHNFLGRAAGPGEVLWTFTGPTYGSCDERRGIVLSERRGENPFFEFPRDAVAPAGLASERENLGRIVRAAWVAWAREQPHPKPSWLTGWDGLTAAEQEADMRIGEAVAAAVRAGAEPPP